MKKISAWKAIPVMLMAVFSAILLIRFLPAGAAAPGSVLGMATSLTLPLSYEPTMAQIPLSEFVSDDMRIGTSQHLSSPEGRAAMQGSMEQTCSITTTASPVFWDTPPQSGYIALLSGQEVIRPGPEDEVRVIIQLHGDPVAAYKSRLRQAPARLTKVEREQVQAYAEEVQEAHRQAIAEIQQLGIPFQMRREYGYIFNGLSASIEMQDMKRIEALPQVRAIYPDYQVRALLDDSVPLIGADQVWAMGVTGAGSEAAILDTGIDYTHPDLGGCFGSGCKVVAGYDFVNGDSDPWDDHGHGTHCAGIVAANGAVKGVAPDASLHAYKVLDEYGSGWDSDIIAAIERAVDPDGDPVTDDAVDVISMSLGGGGDPDEPLALAVDAAVDEGVVVAVAAGNSGPGYQTVESPGVARKAFTVGATDKSDNIASFSSRGPVADFYELTKPEIVAPGYYINSTLPGGGYGYKSGTSMATPHIAGCAALIKQLHPTWTPAMIQANLMNRAKDLDLDIYTQGAGRVQVDDAASVQAVLMPGAVGFGMVDVSQPVWTETETLQLTNVSDGSVDYSLQASGDLPAGVTTSLDPASVTLGAGESVDITFQITVDNALTPYQNQEPGSYEGQVIAQPTVAAQAGVQGVGNPLVMPFAFIKSPVLEITFDESPWIVLIYDGEQRRAERYYPPTVSTFLLPDGTYDVWVIYGPPDTWVIREGVVVSGEGTSLSISRSDAMHTLTLDPRDKDGQPISPEDRLFAQQFTHTPSGYWIGITWRGTSVPLTYHLSDVSSDYSWEWRLDTGWNDAYYEFNGRLTGISGDVTYQNAPGDLWHIRHVCHPGPAFSQVRLGFHPPYGGGWRTSAVAEMVLSAPFVQDAYYIPFDPDFYYSDLYLEVRDPSTSDTLINSPFYLIKEGHEVEAYVPYTWEPVLTTTGDELHLGQAPPHWFGEFANSETTVSPTPKCRTRCIKAVRRQRAATCRRPVTTGTGWIQWSSLSRPAAPTPWRSRTINTG